MAEPSTTAVLVTTYTGVGIASLFPGIDGNALIGAFAGATLFVMSASEMKIIARALYMLISLVMGYIAAPEIIANTFIQSSGVAGFIAGLLCISAALPLVKQLEGTDIVGAIKGLRK